MLLNCGLHLLLKRFPWHWHCEPLSCAIDGCSGPPFPTWSSTYAIASVYVVTFLSLLIEPKSPLQPGGQARSCSLLVLKTSEEWSLFWLLALVLRARGLQPLHSHRIKRLPSMAPGCCQQGPHPTYPSPLTPAACFRAHCLLMELFSMQELC